jgi:hypothetical protein
LLPRAFNLLCEHKSTRNAAAHRAFHPAHYRADITLLSLTSQWHPFPSGPPAPAPPVSLTGDAVSILPRVP